MRRWGGAGGCRVGGLGRVGYRRVGSDHTTSPGSVDAQVEWIRGCPVGVMGWDGMGLGPSAGALRAKGLRIFPLPCMTPPRPYTLLAPACARPTLAPTCPSLAALSDPACCSSWFREFRRDVRASGIVRAVECGIRGVGSATLTATSWTTSKVSKGGGRRGEGSKPQRALLEVLGGGLQGPDGMTEHGRLGVLGVLPHSQPHLHPPDHQQDALGWGTALAAGRGKGAASAGWALPRSQHQLAPPARQHNSLLGSPLCPARTPCLHPDQLVQPPVEPATPARPLPCFLPPDAAGSLLLAATLCCPPAPAPAQAAQQQRAGGSRCCCWGRG